MGFDCGLYKVKRMQGVDAKRVLFISKYLHYINNQHIQVEYPTWEDYIKRHENSDTEFFRSKEKIPDEYIPLTDKELEFYINNDNNWYPAGEYELDYGKDKVMIKEIESWCSSGTVFDDEFRAAAGSDSMSLNYLCEEELTKDKLYELLKWVRDELKGYEFKQVACTKAFICEDFEDALGRPDEKIVALPCDGVEVEDSDGNISRQYASDYEISELYMPVKYFDEWLYGGLSTMRDTLEDILATTDFDKEMILYGSGR